MSRISFDSFASRATIKSLSWLLLTQYFCNGRFPDCEKLSPPILQLDEVSAPSSVFLEKSFEEDCSLVVFKPRFRNSLFLLIHTIRLKAQKTMEKTDDSPTLFISVSESLHFPLSAPVRFL